MIPESGPDCPRSGGTRSPTRSTPPRPRDRRHRPTTGHPEGTGETVKFIEALGIANAFDLAVASKVLSLIEQQGAAHVAFNVSGATIASPASFGMLAALLARRRKLAGKEASDAPAIECAGETLSQFHNEIYQEEMERQMTAWMQELRAKAFIDNRLESQ